MKDYYKILEVQRDANNDQLKKSYRKLAQKWHPDKHQQDTAKQEEAAEKFKEISEAYAVLSDSEKKSNYDLTGDPNTGSLGGFRTTGDPFDIFRHFGGFRNAGPSQPQVMKGQSIQQSVEISLKKALFGGDHSFSYIVNSACSKCNGQGGLEFITCSMCKGSGMYVQKHGNMVMQTTCDSCRGQGKAIKTPCSDCNGQRIVVETKKLNIKIPPGLHNGVSLKIANKGGRGFNGGPPGDIILIAVVKYPEINLFSEEDKEELIRLLEK